MTQKKVFMLESPMTEKARRYDGEPPMIEKSPFPISEESAKKTLNKIAKDPKGEYVKITEDVQSKNPGVTMLIRELVRIHSKNGAPSSDIVEGCLWAYLLAKVSAEEKGIEIPISTEENVASYGESMYVEEKGKDVKGRDLVRQKMEEIGKLDPFFYAAIEEMRKYSIFPDFFYHGATEVYLTINKTVNDGIFATSMKSMGFSPKG
jgi:hypothetical protein